MSRPAAGSATVVAVLAGVQLLAVLDGLAAARALPAIGRELDLGPSGRAWVLNATSVSLAGGLLVAGRLGDRVGRRQLFLTGLVVLGVGSVVCGCAPDAGVLMVGRCLLGLGAAVCYPSALSLTSSLFVDQPWRGRAFAAGAVSGALGSLGGALYGGVVTGQLGWRWVFWLTVPVTVALYLGGLWCIRPDRPVEGRRTTDLLGALLATALVTALVAATVGVGTSSLSAWALTVIVAAGVAAAVALPLVERRSVDPILPGRVLRRRRLLGGCCGYAANSAVWSVVVFVLAQRLQAQGWSATRAGLATLPASAGIVLTGLLVPWTCRRWGAVRTAWSGLVLGACCTVALSLIPAGGVSLLGLAAPLLLLGAGLGATHTALTEHTLRQSVAGAEAVSAAVFEASTHVGDAVSVALYAAALAAEHASVAYLVAAGAAVLGAVAVARYSSEPAVGPVDDWTAHGATDTVGP